MCGGYSHSTSTNTCGLISRKDDGFFSLLATVLLLWRIYPSQCNLHCVSKRKSDGQPKIQENKPNKPTFIKVLGNLSDVHP